ncbi:D-alanyl-D-alanine carboxypeptidase family protein [Paenisporosarcina macmurdoensis]|uniref:D-alanyl-D-alanine carboxypeptidase family protein n=1 Tax=Paenisporosarcina macmurdoensis TaxID=212659 RepID=A0ABW1LCI5_9BACL
MQSSKYRFNSNKKKKWPIVVTVIIGSILIIVPVIWIGLHNWNLDKSVAALNLEQQTGDPSPIIPESTDKLDKQTGDENQEVGADPSEKPVTPVAPDKPSEEPKESPKPPVEKPANNMYEPNQTYPKTPTIKNGIVVANKKYPLPIDYNKGEDLIARAAFNQMAAAAKLDGFELVAFSTFRSFERQETLYNQYVEKDGQQAADQYSARPGYSEHQTGLAFDIGEKNFEQHWAAASFGETPAGEWVAQNAHLYGFILRYPLGKEQVTGYMHESWHYRYVGVEPATDMFTHKQTLEEYLDL